MKRWMAGLVLVAVAAAAGCGAGTLDGGRSPEAVPPGLNTPGGPGGGSSPVPTPTPPPVYNPPPGPSPSPVAPPPVAPPAQPPPPSPPPPVSSPPCTVEIFPDNPPRLHDLLAAQDSRLRVRAEVSGPSAPANPSWKWEVFFEQLSRVDVVPRGAPDTVDFPVRSAGAYFIRAEAAPGCYAEVTATASSASDRVSTFWVRVTPPRPSGLPPQDTTIRVGGRGAPAKTIALERGQLVRIDPHDRNDIAISSFIRVSSPQSTVLFEGHNKDTNMGFSPALLPLLSYDVLVVPDGPVAPILLRGRRPAELVSALFTLDPGVPVSGEILAGAGAGTPVANARVLLRSGRLPSTLGSSDAGGRFELRARPGTWGAVVLPPAGSSLPEAHLDGVIGLGDQPASLRFQWKPLPSARVDVAVTEPGGQPTTRPVRVRIEAEPGALPDVGSLQFGSDGPATATGFLRMDATTGAGGVASFVGVPVGRYHAYAVPPAEATDVAVTVGRIDAGAAQPQRIALARPVQVSGRVLPATLSAGLRIIALDTDSGSPGESASATLDNEGRYILRLAPGRTFRLQIEPAQERNLPRLFLGAVTANADTILPDVTGAAGITFVGTVAVEQTLVPGAVVQVYCTGLPPDCVDPTAPDTDAARPVGETVTGQDGRFQVHLPDPATWQL
jgi:hypothetical protein